MSLMLRFIAFAFSAAASLLAAAVAGHTPVQGPLGRVASPTPVSSPLSVQGIAAPAGSLNALTSDDLAAAALHSADLPNFPNSGQRLGDDPYIPPYGEPHIQAQYVALWTSSRDLDNTDIVFDSLLRWQTVDAARYEGGFGLLFFGMKLPGFSTGEPQIAGLVDVGDEGGAVTWTAPATGQQMFDVIFIRGPIAVDVVTTLGFDQTVAYARIIDARLFAAAASVR